MLPEAIECSNRIFLHSSLRVAHVRQVKPTGEYTDILSKILAKLDSS
jgi:hypothetical protein